MRAIWSNLVVILGSASFFAMMQIDSGHSLPSQSYRCCHSARMLILQPIRPHSSYLFVCCVLRCLRLSTIAPRWSVNSKRALHGQCSSENCHFFGCVRGLLCDPPGLLLYIVSWWLCTCSAGMSVAQALLILYRG